MIQTRNNDDLGRMLVQRRLINAEQLIEALRTHKKEGRPLAEVLLSNGLVAAGDLRAAIAAVINVPVVDLECQPVDPGVLQYIPESLARRHLALPIELRSNILLVAMANPEDLQALEDLKAQTRVRVQAALADPEQLSAAIDRYYKATSEIYKHLRDYTRASVSGEAAPPQAEEALVQTPIIRTLDLLLTQALRDRASDIHIEPQPDRVRVRFRIDGVLHEVIALPLSIHAPLVSRIKILGQMDIAEHRLPQDGQFTYKAAGKEVDVRVASIETTHGERVVLRLLDKTTSLLTLSQLGFLPEALTLYEEMLRVPHGMILVSGPTGSGKTTTLYASVNSMDRRSKNIITIEDPVEYRFADINQIQVNTKAGLTFASGVRAVMRHDPDVILVGEIRDFDTAQTVVQASLTGHLVLSSIHANDTEGVVHRLVNLGVDPFLIASSLVGVVAQRMVRRVCSHCSVEVEAPREEQLSYQNETGETRTKFAYGQGCQFCASTGYRGRTGLFEIMRMTETLREHLLATREPGALKQQAINEGMVTILRDGLTKAKLGLTTPAEVLRTSYYIA